MQRVETLREQANLLRRLAESFELPQIKEDLLHLAARCDELAGNVARALAEERARPIAELGKRGAKEPL
jgi:hypothetical protein